MDVSIFLDGEAIESLVTYCGAYASAGIGLSLVFYMLGYGVWLVIELMRGVI